ncbi:MAG TPA: protein kinase [Phycisphaerae bacterium]|nr:protein kinase [Phycisphaerae bacterium]
MQLTVASLSRTGPVRQNNEDFVAFWTPESVDELRERGAIAIIADGVGGHDNGEVASRLATETALSTFRALKPGATLSSMLWATANQANIAVYDAGAARGGSANPMQTTLTAVVFRNDQVGVAHIGDCRVYHIHANSLKCLTKDHIFVKIGSTGAAVPTTSPLRGGLTRSVGKDPIVAIDFSYSPVYDGDYIVLCTDGVHVFITDREMIEIVTHNSPEQACETLLRLAETRGTEDNITVQICRIDRMQHVEYYRGTPVYREKVQMSNELEVGSLLDDRFEITRLISRSGMASIFEAIDRATANRVALKVPFMQFESDPAFYSRFQREEEIGRSMDHPSILKIVDVPRDSKSRPYIAMELLSGKTLDELMREERPMSVSKASKIMANICDALAYMHEKNIIHRDLKPANVMVCDDGSLRIMDFGIAKAEGMRRITFTGFSPAMGTPDYMAPEQVKGRRGDHRTDIYSAGAILYELTTGHTPFEGQNPFLLMQARITGDPEAPSNFNKDITPALEEIILHAMEREPRNRYNSAREMENDLLHQDSVIITGRVDRLEKPKPWKSKWRSVGGYVALALIPVLVVIIIFLLARGHH